MTAPHQKLHNWFIDWLTREPPAEDAVSLYDYDRLRYEIRPGDVLLMEGRSRVSNVIRYVTQSPWTHAALYIGRFHDIEDRELKKMVRHHLTKRENVRLVIESVLGKGTVVMPLSHYRGSHIRICRPTGLSPEDAQIVVNHAVRALGNPYSVRTILDLLRFLLPWSLFPRRWGSSLFRTAGGEIERGVCSTLIAECFSMVQFPILPLIRPDEEGITLIKRNIHLYTPRDFDYSPWFEIIKFPALDPDELRPYYRRMPWSETAVHNDHGVVSEPSVAKNTKNAKKIAEKFPGHRAPQVSATPDEPDEPDAPALPPNNRREENP